jgi:hypothetical protein
MELPILIHTWTFLAIIFVASQLFLCLFWISLWLGIGVYKHPCFKILCKIAQASKNSNSNAQHLLWDLLTHSWFHSMLFALPSYQFPYIIMNRCFYLMPKNLLDHWSEVNFAKDTPRTVAHWRWCVCVAKTNLRQTTHYTQVSQCHQLN